jgi:ADP-heptose:LPS heptosyltransferase
LDCEGGLVHLATQLGTKCIVLFGPTAPHYFGYEQNVNIATDICGDCRWIAADWMVHCYRSDEKLVCMRSITPAMVLERVAEVLGRI